MPGFTPSQLSLIISIDITNTFKIDVPGDLIVDSDWRRL